MILRIAAALLCFLMWGRAAYADDTDPSVIVDNYLQHFEVESDGSYRLTVDHAKTIAQKRAVAQHSQYYISYNRSLDEVSAVAAYTRKPDGRRVDVQSTQIKDQQEAVSVDAPMFQDTRMKIIVFPEVEVGDQLVVRYVLTRHTPLFPGHFEDLSSSQFYANPQFHLIYDMPVTMPLYADARGFEPVPTASPAGRKRYQWHYVSGPNTRPENDAVSYLDYGKRLAVSTFPSYAAFAQAYGARARSKAAGNGQIGALAASITHGMADPRAKVLALSDWVRRHIRYVGVYVGAGGVVPHDAATVLANRYGDCKDHAVLLEALLAAIDIDSSAALVNNGKAYRLPSTPTLGVFNHVITWVPSLGLYLDSTAESIAAGFLPSSVMDKTVLLAKTGTLARTPAVQPERQRTSSLFSVRRDGRSSFKVTRLAEGAIAEPYRQAVRDTRPSERKLLVQQMLQGLGQQGEGVFDAGDVDGTGDRYLMRIAGTSGDFAQLPGPTGLATSFNFWGGLGETLLTFAQEGTRTQDFVCPAIDSEDETGFLFASGIRIIALPKNVRLRDAHFSYEARYARRGNRVTVTRRVAFRHEGMVCSAAAYRRMQPVLERILRDLKSQVIISAALTAACAPVRRCAAAWWRCRTCLRRPAAVRAGSSRSILRSAPVLPCAGDAARSRRRPAVNPWCADGRCPGAGASNPGCPAPR